MLILLMLACSGGGSEPVDTNDPWDTQDPGDDTGDPVSPELELLSVEEGATCPVRERMGWIQLYDANTGAGSGSGVVYDAPVPTVGPATIEEPDCTYHLYDRSVCGGCPGEQVCNGDGVCVDQPRTFKDLVLTGVSASESFTWEDDSGVGYVYGAFSDTEGPWELELSFGGLTVDLPPLALAPALEGLELVVDVDEDWNYGALDISWTPSDAGGLVHTEIPINHHAAPGTFTVCEVPSDDGSIHATAEQIAPLSVHTGLEFQGLSHVNAVAVHTSLGCVEVLAGAYMYEFPVEE